MARMFSICTVKPFWNPLHSGEYQQLFCRNLLCSNHDTLLQTSAIKIRQTSHKTGPPTLKPNYHAID